MKVLVTGGSGFLGSHIADALSDAGHHVTIFDRCPSPWLRADQAMLVGDILDAAALADAARGCDAIYHLAAMADITAAMDEPRRTVEVNIVGTLNALAAAHSCSVGRFILASTIYVYSDKGSFYRTSKRAAEQLVADCQERYGTPYTILRFGSLYGPRAGETNAIHRMLRQALTERRIEYGGTGEEVREYIHVLDAAAMSVDILAPEFTNQIVHLTGRERITTRAMLEMIGEILGGDVSIVLRGDGMTGHYIQTPYSFNPRLGRKLTRNAYIDLGLGLIDCLERLHADSIAPLGRPEDGDRAVALVEDCRLHDRKGT